MKKSSEAKRPGKRSEGVAEFEKRAQNILDRLDRADQILGDLQTRPDKPDKTTDTFQEILEPIERGVKKLISQAAEIIAEEKQPKSLIPKRLAQFLQSCPDEQLEVIRNEIDRTRNREEITINRIVLYFSRMGNWCIRVYS